MWVYSVCQVGAYLTGMCGVRNGYGLSNGYDENEDYSAGCHHGVEEQKWRMSDKGREGDGYG